jgi:hypothetical protein
MSEYIDTSIIVKWFKEGEEHRDKSLVLRERVTDLETEFVMSYYGAMNLSGHLSRANIQKWKSRIPFRA